MKGKRMRSGSLYWRYVCIPAWMVSMSFWPPLLKTVVAQQASLTWPIPHAIKEEILAICQGQSLTLFAARSSGHPSGTAVCRCRTGADAPGKSQTHRRHRHRLPWTDRMAEPQGEAPHTLQIGDNNQIAAHTGITVVGDFRRRDGWR